MIRTQRLTKNYGSTAALSNVDLSVDSGEIVALIGRSGAGKSTLMRVLNGYITPSSGTATVANKDIAALDAAALRALRTQVGMIYQQFNLVRRASAYRNVAHGAVGRTSTVATLVGHIARADRERAADALDRVGLLERWNQRCDTLSGGQQQRVAIARLLLQDARVVLADEPVASLDPGSSARIMHLLADLAHSDGRTVLVSLHQVELARRFCDRIVALDDGHLMIDAPVSEVTTSELGALFQLTEEHGGLDMDVATTWPSPISDKNATTVATST